MQQPSLESKVEVSVEKVSSSTTKLETVNCLRPFVSPSCQPTFPMKFLLLLCSSLAFTKQYCTKSTSTSTSTHNRQQHTTLQHTIRHNRSTSASPLTRYLSKYSASWHLHLNQFYTREDHYMLAVSPMR